MNKNYHNTSPYDYREKTHSVLTFPQLDENEGLEEIIIEESINKTLWLTILITASILLIVNIAKF